LGVLNVCICYNSKDEINEALEKTEQNLKGRNKNKNAIEEFESNLLGGYNVQPEIYVRTSGEIRMSNFLLYQSDKSQI
jgi:undecaprenyl diphosphate synthase